MNLPLSIPFLSRLTSLFLISGQSLAATEGLLPDSNISIRFSLALAGVLLLIYGVAWLLRGLGWGNSNKQTSQIKLISSLALGNRERIILIQSGTSQLLVGLSSKGMVPLATLADSTQTTESHGTNPSSKITTGQPSSFPAIPLEMVQNHSHR